MKYLIPFILIITLISCDNSNSPEPVKELYLKVNNRHDAYKEGYDVKHFHNYNYDNENKLVFIEYLDARGNVVGRKNYFYNSESYVNETTEYFDFELNVRTTFEYFDRFIIEKVFSSEEELLIEYEMFIDENNDLDSMYVNNLSEDYKAYVSYSNISNQSDINVVVENSDGGYNYQRSTFYNDNQNPFSLLNRYHKFNYYSEKMTDRQTISFNGTSTRLIENQLETIQLNEDLSVSKSVYDHIDFIGTNTYEYELR